MKAVTAIALVLLILFTLSAAGRIINTQTLWTGTPISVNPSNEGETATYTVCFKVAEDAKYLFIRFPDEIIDINGALKDPVVKKLSFGSNS